MRMKKITIALAAALAVLSACEKTPDLPVVQFDKTNYILPADEPVTVKVVSDVAITDDVTFTLGGTAAKDVDYTIINSNYAINAGLNPVNDSLLIEDSASAYSNILAVKEGNENTDKIKALKAALESKQVADYIAKEYKGSVVSVVANPGDGYDSTVDYAALSGSKISIAASPTPHADILKVVKVILAEKNITLDIQEFTDYVQPNNVVNDGQLDANYFQHKPYLDDFNQKNGTKVVSVGAIHVEPMGLYGGRQSDLAKLNK